MGVIPEWMTSRTAHAPARRATRVGAALVVLATVTCGCGGTKSTRNSDNLSVHLRDFAIDISRTRLTAGHIEIDIANLGPTTHEFNLDETSLHSDKLPREDDGLTVDEDSPELHRVTAVEGIDLGKHAKISLDLPPGHYVLYCNLEGHYLGSMHTEIEVVAPPRSPS